MAFIAPILTGLASALQGQTTLHNILTALVSGAVTSLVVWAVPNARSD